MSLPSSLVTGAAVLSASAGVYLLFSAVALGQRQLVSGRATARSSVQHWLAAAGIPDVRPGEFALVVGFVFVFAAGTVWLVFGIPSAALLAGLLVAGSPVASYRARRIRLAEQARDAWPYLIEEIRLLTGALGRSVPVAVFEAGRRAPVVPMQRAFEAAGREWLLSTDFARATAVLKAQLADATADVVCETLLVAHEVGGTDVDRRLAALVDDRRTDLRHRHEARSRQAGVRFARLFVLIVPVGMALVGLGIGDGRAAYQTTGGQLAVGVAILLTAACWWWASRIMAPPRDERVFTR